MGKVEAGESSACVERTERKGKTLRALARAAVRARAGRAPVNGLRCGVRVRVRQERVRVCACAGTGCQLRRRTDWEAASINMVGPGAASALVVQKSKFRCKFRCFPRALLALKY